MDMLKEADRDGNGKIDYGEFCELLRSRSLREGSRDGKRERRRGRQSKQTAT